MSKTLEPSAETDNKMRSSKMNMAVPVVCAMANGVAGLPGQQVADACRCVAISLAAGHDIPSGTYRTPFGALFGAVTADILITKIGGGKPITVIHSCLGLFQKSESCVLRFSVS